MTERTRFKAWITKYALTKGIYEVQVIDFFHVSPDMVMELGRLNPVYHGGHDWHRDRASAVKRAEEMRTAKIASLRKSIEKLEKMRFDL